MGSTTPETRRAAGGRTVAGFRTIGCGADESTPVQGSRTTYAVLRKAGAGGRYTEYPDTKRGENFRKAWNEVDLPRWIFVQRRE